MKMNHGWILILAVLTLSGCQPDTGTSSKVSIRIPTKEEFQKANKVSAMSAIDYSLLCFAVNVRGGTIPVLQRSCDVPRGITSGSVPAGSDIIIDVPFGFAITFEIYGLLRNSTTEACPKVNERSGWNFPLNKVFLLGETNDVRIEKAETQVVIGVRMPEEGNHIAQTLNFPATCTAGLEQDRSHARFPMAAGVQAGSLFRAYSRISNKDDIKTLTGSEFKIRHWMTGVGP